VISTVQLTSLLETPGRWTYAYVDGRGADPQVVEESRRDSVKRRLVEAGAPDADAEAVLGALEQPGELPSPSARYLLVRDGEVEVDESMPGARLGPEQLGHGAIPPVLPLLRDLADDVRYLVVEAGRGDAEIRLERAGRSPELREEVEGSMDALPKVQAGGWSHLHYQRSAEETWRHNQSDLAGIVDRLVQERSPRFLVVSGDVRARQMLREQLGAAAQKLLVDVDAHTHAPGADRSALDEAIAQELQRERQAREQDVVDRASADNGSAGARGVEEVVAALRQAQVDSLLLDARLVESEETLDALDAEPWVARTDADALNAGIIGRIPVAEALARAALLTGARVLVAEEDAGAPDEPRSHRTPREPIAALRWPEPGAAAAG